MENADHYFRGDACKWTGEAEEHYKGLFYVYTVMEGHRAGDRILSPDRHTQWEDAGKTAHAEYKNQARTAINAILEDL